MCDVLGRAIAAVPSVSRRRVLAALAAGAATAGAGALDLAAAPAASAAPTAAAASSSTAAARTRLVLLGTLGGPLYLDPGRAGTCTAIVHDGRVYLVDLGMGAYFRLVEHQVRDGRPTALSQVAGIFFTHLHGDHTTDWPSVYATGSVNIAGRTASPVQVFGPGDRGTLPRVFPPTRAAPELVAPQEPTPGIAGMTRHLREAFAQDANDRLRDAGIPDPGSLFRVTEIDLTGVWDVDPLGVPPRLAAPLRVWQDGDVTVTATLVDHRPTAPAFGYRFDTPRGSVVVSGDTAVSQNLVDLARGADYLVHEVIDPAFVDQLAAALPPELAGPVRQHLLSAHTTIEQVGRDVAEPAGVKTLVLTHLLPGTAPASRWLQARRGYSGRVVVGRDLLELPLPG